MKIEEIPENTIFNQILRLFWSFYSGKSNVQCVKNGKFLEDGFFNQNFWILRKKSWKFFNFGESDKFGVKVFFFTENELWIMFKGGKYLDTSWLSWKSINLQVSSSQIERSQEMKVDGVQIGSPIMLRHWLPWLTRFLLLVWLILNLVKIRKFWGIHLRNILKTNFSSVLISIPLIDDK